MVRPPLSDEDRERGRALGAALRQARGELSPLAVSAAAGISSETLRKIESGRIPTPAFATVVALARVLDQDLETLAGLVVSVPAVEPAAVLTA